VAVVGAFAFVVLLCSILSVLRYTAPYLQADGILQAVMSVQDVELFYWGQNRLASVVSLLASPIADPMVNLFVCLLINALSFHLLLLVLAWMGARVVTGQRGWRTTMVLFLVTVATAHTVIAPDRLYTMAIDAQPYAMSWALTLGAFLLWKRQQWWAFAVSVAMIGIAAGLNPSAILIAAFLAAVEMVRRRQWIRWPALGAVWLAWFLVWLKLSQWFPGAVGPIPDAPQDYFGFDPALFVTGAPQSLAQIAAAIRPIRFVVLLVVACLSTLLLSAERRSALLPRLALAGLFCALYWAVFTGNSWVAANLYTFRYFYPVVVGIVLILAAPIAGALVTLTRHVPSPGRSAVPIGVAAVAVAASLWGPLAPPSQAVELLGSKATADYARANDVAFVSGFYWLVWPTELQMLEDGRTAAYAAAFRSDGDPGGYEAALDRELAESDGPPRAICVGDSSTNCVTYLEYWTRPGWREVPGECPAPNDGGRHGIPPQPGCRLLEFQPQ
jgi:hypothetical protein